MAREMNGGGGGGGNSSSDTTAATTTMTTSTVHKGCNSSNCCSPAKLWRTLQQFIKANDKKGLNTFFKDARLQHIVRVALTSRITNDASMLPPSQKHKIIRITGDSYYHKYLGKSFTDLNSLQLALLTSSESMVLTLLAQLKLHASPQELKHYLNHVWGQGNTCLHLAVYLKRHLVVKALLDLGCKLDHLNARLKNAVDCCYDGDQSMIDLLSHKKQHETVVVAVPVAAAGAAVIIPMATTAPIKIESTITMVTTPGAEVVPSTEVTTITTVPSSAGNMTIPSSVGNNMIVPGAGNTDANVSSIITTHDEALAKEMMILLKRHIVNKIIITKQQHVSLAQLKKPPDILMSYGSSSLITCF